MVDTSVHWARPPWQGVALAIRDSCRLLALRQINDAFAAELGGLNPKHEARESALQLQMGERRARATVWLERFAWSEEPPLKLGEVRPRSRSSWLRKALVYLPDRRFISPRRDERNETESGDGPH